jgi:CRP/FNR family nitrogen fixation transcriptional regulator
VELNMISTDTATQSFQNASRLSAGRTVAITASLQLPGFTMTFDRDEEIFGEGESADFIYRVVLGAVRITRLLDDGRRLISDFYLPGDVFGLEMGETHGACAEAVTDCEVALVKRVAVERVAAQDHLAAGTLWSLTSQQLRSAQDHLVVLGRRSAAEKVGRFLLDMAGRSGGTVIHLPMSRADIADYLGLTIETVSRTMTQLERQGAITMKGCREIVLRTLASL